MKLIVKTNKSMLFFTRQQMYSNLNRTKSNYGIFTALRARKMKLILSNSYTHTANYLRKFFVEPHLIVKNFTK